MILSCTIVCLFQENQPPSFLLYLLYRLVVLAAKSTPISTTTTTPATWQRALMMLMRKGRWIAAHSRKNHHIPILLLEDWRRQRRPWQWFCSGESPWRLPLEQAPQQLYGWSKRLMGIQSKNKGRQNVPSKMIHLLLLVLLVLLLHRSSSTTIPWLSKQPVQFFRDPSNSGVLSRGKWFCHLHGLPLCSNNVAEYWHCHPRRRKMTTPFGIMR